MSDYDAAPPFRQKPLNSVPAGQSQEAVDASPSELSGGAPIQRPAPAWKSFVQNANFQEANRAGIAAEQQQMRASRSRSASSTGNIFRGDANGRLIHKAPGQKPVAYDANDWVDHEEAGPEARKALWSKEIATNRQEAEMTNLELANPAFQARELAKKDREAMLAEGSMLAETDPRHAELKSKLKADDDYRATKADMAQRAWNAKARAAQVETMDPEAWWQQRQSQPAPTPTEQRQATVQGAQAKQAEIQAADDSSAADLKAINDKLMGGVTGEESKALQAQRAEILAARPKIAEAAVGVQKQMEGVQADAQAAAAPQKDFWETTDVISGIWDAVKGLGSAAPAAFYQLSEGLVRPDQYSDSAKAAFAEADKYNAEMQAKTAANQKAGTSSSAGETFRELGSSLGFTAVGMGTQLSVKGAAALAGIGTGAAAGAAGGPAAPVTSPVGAAIGGIGSWVASEAPALAAGAATAYRMAGASYLNDAFNYIKQVKGRDLTEAEAADYYQKLLPHAQSTALAESVPEAVGNSISLKGIGAIAGIGKKAAAGAVVKTLAGRMKDHAITGAKMILGELGTETITAQYQTPDQKNAEAIAHGEAPTAKPDWSAGGLADSLKSVAPQVVAQTALLGAVGGGIRAGVNALGSGRPPTNPDGTPDNSEAIREQVNTALAGLDPTHAPAEAADIKNAMPLVRQGEGASGVAEAILIERDLTRVSMEDNETLVAAQETRAAAKQAVILGTGKAEQVKAAEEAVAGVRGRAETARAVLKVAAGKPLDELKPAELKSLGLGKNKKGELDVLPAKELEAMGLTDSLAYPSEHDGSMILTDEAIDRVRAASPIAAERVSMDETTAIEKAKARAIEAETKQAEIDSRITKIAKGKYSVQTPAGTQTFEHKDDAQAQAMAQAASAQVSTDSQNATQGEPAGGSSLPGGSAMGSPIETNAPVEFDVPMRVGPPVRVQAATADEAEGIAAGMFEPGQNSVLPGQAVPVQPTTQANDSQIPAVQGPSQAQPAGPTTGSDPAALPGNTGNPATPEVQPTPAVADPGQAAVATAKARVAKIASQSPEIAAALTTGPASANATRISIDPDAIIGEALGRGLSEKEATARFNAILDEEIKHLSQERAAKRKYRDSSADKLGGSKEEIEVRFREWRKTYYGGRWVTEFVKTGKDKIARTLYAKGSAAGLARWDAMSDADKFMEATRMMMQRREKGSMVTEASKLWYGITKELAQDLLAMLRELRKMVKNVNISPELKADIEFFENELKNVLKSNQPRARSPKADSTKPAQGGKGNGNASPSAQVGTGEAPNDSGAVPPRSDQPGSPLAVGQRVSFIGPDGSVIEGTIRLSPSQADPSRITIPTPKGDKLRVRVSDDDSPSVFVSDLTFLDKAPEQKSPPQDTAEVAEPPQPAEKPASQATAGESSDIMTFKELETEFWNMAGERTRDFPFRQEADEMLGRKVTDEEWDKLEAAFFGGSEEYDKIAAESITPAAPTGQSEGEVAPETQNLNFTSKKEAVAWMKANGLESGKLTKLDHELFSLEVPKGDYPLPKAWYRMNGEFRFTDAADPDNGFGLEGPFSRDFVQTMGEAEWTGSMAEIKRREKGEAAKPKKETKPAKPLIPTEEIKAPATVNQPLTVQLTPEEEQAKKDIFALFEGVVDGLQAADSPDVIPDIPNWNTHQKRLKEAETKEIREEINRQYHETHPEAKSLIIDRAKRKIPPGWVDVMIFPEGSIVPARGKDSKGRPVSVRTSEADALSAAKKFARAKNVSQAMPQAIQQIGNDLESGTSPEESSVLRLIYLTGFRNGGDSDTGAKVKAYGASTLRAEHVEINGDTVTFDFIGKLGVRQQHTIINGPLARDLEERKAHGGALFKTTATKVLARWKQVSGNSEFIVHDLRTWNATELAAAIINENELPTNPTDFWLLRDHVGDIVARKLGDTRSVVLESYIDPIVFAKWRDSASIGHEEPRPKISRRDAENRGSSAQLGRTTEEYGRSLRDDYLPTGSPTSSSASSRRVGGSSGLTLYAASSPDPISYTSKPDPSKLPAANKAAQSLIAAGVKSPDALGAFLEKIAPGKLRAYSEFLWRQVNSFLMGDNVETDWSGVYGQLDNANQKANVPTDDNAPQSEADSQSPQAGDAVERGASEPVAPELRGETTDSKPAEQLPENDGRPGGIGDSGTVRGNAPRSGAGSGDSEQAGGDGTKRGGKRSPQGTDSIERGDGIGVAGGEQPAGITGYRLTDPESIIGAGGPKARFARNKLALETYDTVLSENRKPTAEEQDALASYIGWGSFGQELFQGSWDRPNPQPAFAKESEWLRDHLGQAGWESIRDSIINAHYTDPPHIQALWRIVEHLGFKGGRVLEPSMGIGSFFGLMPDVIRSKSSLTGIELDRVVGGMAQMLYPDANIRIMGYEKSATADGFYDLVIGNWPFAKEGPSDPRYNSLGLSLHDYFFVKALDQTRPGGLVIGITSSGTMDKKGQTARRQMARRADLVAAFRFPTGAFEKYAGTKVVTDVVILKKRETPASAVEEDGWMNTEQNGKGNETFNANEYWRKHPENVLGEMKYGHGTTQGRAGMIVERQDDYQEKLARIEQSLPKDILTKSDKPERVTFQNREGTADQNSVTWSEKDGAMPAGFYIVRGEQLQPLEDLFTWTLKEEKKTEKRRDELKQLLGLREDIKELLRGQREGDPQTEAIRARAKVKYDAFVKAHGAIGNSFMLKALDKSGDPMALTLKNLERAEGGAFVPRDILLKDIMRRPVADAKGDIGDAYAIQRNQNTTLDVEAIAKLAGKPVDEVIDRLVELDQIYKTPTGTWEPSEEYLGGNVRRKLREARDAKEQGIDMDRNITALEKVQPKDVAYFEIEVQMGASWIPREDYLNFASHLLSSEAETAGKDFELTRAISGWNFKINNDSLKRGTGATATWGTQSISFAKIFQAAMNGTTVKIYDTDSDGVKHLNTEETDLANKKIDDIREELANWLWSDPTRSGRIANDYNEVMNSEVVPKRNGSHLRFEGLALTMGTTEFDFRQHQKDSVWRGIMDGQMLAAHEVGTGKTFTMAGLAVEGRRLGKFRKSLVFAHNANAESVYKDFQAAYPGGKFLFIDSLSPTNRENAMRQIANDEWDAIIVTHSLIDRFALREETLMEIAQKQIKQLESEIADALQDLGVNSLLNIDDEAEVSKALKFVKDSHTAKELVKTRNRIIKRIKDKAAKAMNDNAVFFEDLGVDAIMVDEAHMFKKIALATRKEVKGLNKTESDRGWMLGALTDTVKARNNGKGVFLFTGTPLTNNLNEAYNMMRFVMDDAMEAAGLNGFDDWFNSFAQAVSDVELTTGGTYEPVTRLLSFINVPELARLAGRYFDVVQAKSMPEFIPRSSTEGKTPGGLGRPFKVMRPVTAEMTSEQKDHKRSIQARYKAFQALSGKEKRKAMLNGVNTPIQLESEGIKAALDMRLIDPTLPDSPDSKANLMVRNAISHYQEDPKATQMIFMERGWNDFTDAQVSMKDENGMTVKDFDGKKITSKQRRPQFNLVRDMVEKLVAQGVRPDEIAVFSNMTLDPVKDRPGDVLRNVNRVSGSVSKEDLAALMREGKIRFAFGSTQTMGTGVNAQDNMRAMHHLDAPWTPGEFEQRNGRGHRQGNQWNTVYEYRYFTEGSHDGRRWQVLLNKVKFISRFTEMLVDAGGSSLRVLTGDGADLNEGGSDVADFESSFSTAAGDPRILVRAKLKGDVEKLERRRDTHYQSIERAKGDIKRLKQSKTYSNGRIKSITSALERWNKAKEGPFSIKIGEKTYTDRKEVEALLTAFPSLTQKDSGKLIAEYNGAKIFHRWQAWEGGKSTFQMDLPTDTDVVVLYPSLSLGSIEATVRGQTRVLNNIQEEFGSIDGSVASLEEMIQKPFTRESELETKQAALQQIQVELDRAPQPAPSWLRNGAPVGSLVYLEDGKAYDVAAHRWDENGWWVLVENESGMQPVDYRKVMDETGHPMFEEVEFTAPDRSGSEEDEDSNVIPGITITTSMLQGYMDAADESIREKGILGATRKTARNVNNAAMDGWLFNQASYRKTDGRLATLRRLEAKLEQKSENDNRPNEPLLKKVRSEIKGIELQKMSDAKSGTHTSLRAADSPDPQAPISRPQGTLIQDITSGFSKPPSQYTFKPSNEQRPEIKDIADQLEIEVVDSEDLRDARRVFEESTGTTVVFFRGGNQKLGWTQAFTTAKYPRLIFINSEVDSRPISASLAHELIHVAQKDAAVDTDRLAEQIHGLLTAKEFALFKRVLLAGEYRQDEIQDEIQAHLAEDAISGQELVGLSVLTKGAQIGEIIREFFKNLPVLNPQKFKTKPEDNRISAKGTTLRAADSPDPQAPISRPQGTLIQDITSGFSKPPSQYTFKPSNENDPTILRIAQEQGVELVDSESLHAAQRRLEERTGARAVFFKGKADTTGFTPADAPTLIFIQTEGHQVPIDWTIDHELTHIAQRDKSVDTVGLYDRIDTLIEDAEYDALVNLLKRMGYDEREIPHEIQAFIVSDSVSSHSAMGTERMKNFREIKDEAVRFFNALPVLNPTPQKIGPDTLRAAVLPPDSARHATLEAKHNAGTITPEETAEAERIVEARAREAGYNIPGWHSSPSKGFTQFDPARIGSATDHGFMGRGFYFYNNQTGGRFYSGANGETRKFLLKMESPVMGDIVTENEGRDLPAEHDSAIWPGGGEYMVKDPSQIKSADPFTGVPLDKRFDSGSDSILFAADSPDPISRGRAAFEKNRKLFEQAQEQAKDYGRQIIGADPKFANPGLSPNAREPFDIARMIDSHQREVRMDRDTFAKGREYLEKFPQAVEQLLLDNAYGGENSEPIADYQQHAINLLLDRRAQDAMGDTKKMQDLYVLATANIINGREQARAFRMRMDRFANPEERAQHAISDAIFTPNKKTAARAELMAPKARREFLAEQGKKRIAEVEAELQKRHGLKIKNILGKNRDLQLKNSKLEKEMLKLRNTLEKDVLKAIQAGANSADIKRRFKLSADEAKAILESARKEMGAKIKAMLESGMTREQIRESMKDTLKAADAPGSANNAMTPAQIDAMVEQMLVEDMGYASPDAWEKIKPLPSIKAKKENLESPVETHPLSANWNRPEFNDGMNGLRIPFDTTDRANVMTRVETIRNLAGAMGKIEASESDWKAYNAEVERIKTLSGIEKENAQSKLKRPEGLTGDKLAEAKKLLKEIDAILAKYQTSAEDIFEAGKGIESYGFDISDIAHVATVARTINAIDADIVDKATEYLYASMLSGLQTMMVNATAILPAVWESTVGRGVSMAINRFVQDPMAEQYGEAKYMMKALAPAISRAKSNFVAAMAAQHPMFDRDVNAMEIDWDKILGGGSHRMIGSIRGKKGDIIRLPMRLLTATDDFNRTLMACVEVGTFAYRMAKMKGMKDGSAEMDQFIRKEVNTPGSLSYNLASRKASSAIFSNPLPGQHDTYTKKKVEVNDMGDVVGFIAGKLTDAVSGEHDNIFMKALSAALRISFFPFQRTPFNIIRKGVRHTLNPFSLADIALGVYRNAQDADGKWNWKITGNDEAAFQRHLHRAELVTRMGQQLQGAVLMTILVAAAAGEGDDDDQDKRFIMTGSSPFLPTGRSERDTRMRSGLGPFRISVRNADGSERIGLSYGRLEPVATILAATIDTIKSMKRTWRGGGDNYDASMAAMGGLVSQVQDKSFMKGIGDFIKLSSAVMAEPDVRENRKALQFLAGRLAMVVPNIIKQPIRESDDQFREKSQSFIAEVMYQAAPIGQSNPKIDPYGNALTKPGVAPLRPIDPMDIGSDSVNKVDEMLIRWQDSGKWQKAQDPADRKAWFPSPIVNATFQHKVTGQTVKMSESQLQEFREKAGKAASAKLKGLSLNFKDPSFQDIQKVKEAISDSRRLMKEALSHKFSRTTKP